MIVDAHTHLFPPEVIADHQAFRERDAWFHEAFASPNVAFATPESMLAEMDRSGVDVAIVAPWPWQDPGLCRHHSAWLAEACRSTNGRLRWMAIVNPVDHDAASDIAEARRSGAVGLGEINADGQGFDWRDIAALQVAVDASVENGLPWMIHTSEPTGHAYPGKGTATPEKIVDFVTAFPDLQVVCAHWGGGLPIYELMPEVRDVMRNVAYDCAATTYLYDHRIFEIVTRIVGPERIVFGSDYPVLGMKRLLAKVRTLDLDHSALLATNAARIYGIETGESNP